jgi:hypothetical protein
MCHVTPCSFAPTYQRQIKKNGKWGVRKFAENLGGISKFQATLGWPEVPFWRLKKSGDTIGDSVVGRLGAPDLCTPAVCIRPTFLCVVYRSDNVLNFYQQNQLRCSAFFFTFPIPQLFKFNVTSVLSTSLVHVELHKSARLRRLSLGWASRVFVKM